MRRSKLQPIRNKIDLADRIQMRLIKKRLKLSDAELTAIVGRIGNSLSATSKEAALQRASTVLAAPTEVPPAAVIASRTGGEQATIESEAGAPAS
ncbi:putative Zn-dependent protease [Bradyrhizobium sp. S3.9.2]|uniref:hypothetical protein n=1 Tax=Bradyrhizobium sp. S3.9.2 TaxID=3156432 RepID=UPI00339542CD